jgi:hypothetical protein
VELKCVCNDVGCTAEKKGNFEYANARASAREVTVSKRVSWNSAKYQSKAADRLLENHKGCLPSKEEIENECDARRMAGHCTRRYTGMSRTVTTTASVLD